jgi:hypothetical protein
VKEKRKEKKWVSESEKKKCLSKINFSCGCGCGWTMITNKIGKFVSLILKAASPFWIILYLFYYNNLRKVFL